MKLELKHLASYLPYKLEGKYKLTDVDENYPKEIRNKQLRYSNVGFFIRYCKPILRPLFLLFDEIEIKGNKFIPVELLDSDSYPVDYFDVEMNFYEYLENWVASKDKTHHVNFLPFGFIQQLLEWHFDIFGLIDAKLAVDINCL